MAFGGRMDPIGLVEFRHAAYGPARRKGIEVELVF